MPLPLTAAVMAAVFFTIAPGTGLLDLRGDEGLSAITRPAAPSLWERGRAGTERLRSGVSVLR